MGRRRAGEDAFDAKLDPVSCYSADRERWKRWAAAVGVEKFSEFVRGCLPDGEPEPAAVRRLARKMGLDAPG